VKRSVQNWKNSRELTHGVQMNVGQTAVIKAGVVVAGPRRRQYCAVYPGADFPLADALGGAQGDLITLQAQGTVDAALQAAERLTPPVATGARVSAKD